MSTPLPVTFSGLPVGLNPLSLFDQQFNAATNGAYMQDGTLPASALVNSGVTAGTYGDGSNIPRLTVDAQGLLTSVSQIALSIAVTQISGLGAGIATWLATPTSANLAAAVADETGSGALVFATSPTLVTPALGTPSALVATNATGTAAGLTAGTATVANGLKTATTTVVVSSATAPSAGQVLTATSSTAANWAAAAGGITPVTTRTALAALSTSLAVAYLEEAGRQGTFQWNGANLSTQVTSDPQQGIYVAPSSDTSGASGAWVRQGDWVVTGVFANWFGVVFDNSTDNTTKLQAAIDFAKAGVKRLRMAYGICICASSISLDNTTGLIIEGASGGPTGGASPGTVWKFTGLTAGITAHSSVGLNIRDILIQNTNASWASILLDMSSTTTDTAFLTVQRCVFSSVSAASGSVFIALNKNIVFLIEDCNFSGAYKQITGGNSGAYCNVGTIRNCQFVGYGFVPITSSASDTWTIEGNNFEQGNAGQGAGITGTFFGLRYHSNYHGDATAAGYWVNLTGSAGLDFRGNVFSGYSAAGATIGILLAGTTVSFVIEANRFYTLNTAVSLTTSTDYGQVNCNYNSGCTNYVAGALTHTSVTNNF